MTPAPDVRGSRRRRALATLPTFALYGEEGSAAAPLLHIESIDARSRQYDWEIDAHVHPGLHQVLWVSSGQVQAMFDESRTTCEGPAALIVPPGVAHAFRFPRTAEGFVLTFNATLLAEGDVNAVGDPLRTLFTNAWAMSVDRSAPEASRLQALFEALHAESHAPDSADGPIPQWLARAVVWRLARLGQRERQTGQRGALGRQSLYTRWVVLLESHYREHWPVSRYAHELGLAAERLNRIVRAETGHNAQHLIHARLAREACRRLVHVAAPVSKLAFELGFNDPAYFCRFFKRQTGSSPRAYRTLALQG